MARILTEDEVLDAVTEHLVERGWRIVTRARATERGHDLVAELDGERLVIEAKGAGSSKPGTARYGEPFDKGQVFSHVAKAVLKALRAVSSGDRAGIALPDDPKHRWEIAQVGEPLDRLDVTVFWVAGPPGSVVETQGM